MFGGPGGGAGGGDGGWGSGGLGVPPELACGLGFGAGEAGALQVGGEGVDFGERPPVESHDGDEVVRDFGGVDGGECLRRHDGGRVGAFRVWRVGFDFKEPIGFWKFGEGVFEGGDCCRQLGAAEVFDQAAVGEIGVVVEDRDEVGGNGNVGLEASDAD